MPGAAPFGSLDFLYVPSRDVAEDLRWFGEVLGGRVVFAIDSMGTRVAAVELSDDPPLVLLTDHLEGDRPVLVYRVPDLNEALDTLEGRGWRREHRFEIRETDPGRVTFVQAERFAGVLVPFVRKMIEGNTLSMLERVNAELAARVRARADAA